MGSSKPLVMSKSRMPWEKGVEGAKGRRLVKEGLGDATGREVWDGKRHAPSQGA